MVNRMRRHTSLTLTRLCRLLLASCLTLCAALLASTAQAQRLQSLVDRSTLAEDETLQLTVRFSGSGQQGQPDFSELKNSFDILSTSQSNQFQNINGQITAYTDWIMILAPKQAGTALIPSFKFAGQISDAIVITVTPAAQPAPGTLKDVFIETVIEKDSAYVQEQILVKYRLLYSVNISDLETETMVIDNVLIERLPDVKYNRVIQGKTYGVAEFNYALFAQTSGEIEVPPLNWNIKVGLAGANQSFLGFSGRYQINRQRTEGKVLKIKPVPAEFPTGQPWLPAHSITLEEIWATDPTQFTAGEPKTRSVLLKAEGLMAAQLPRVWGERDYGAIKVYADQPTEENSPTDRGFISSRTESAAVVISTPGEVVLPAIKLPWWDLKNDRLNYAEIPQRVIRTAGSGNAAPTANSTATSQAQVTQNSGMDKANNSDTSQLSAELAALKNRLRLWQAICAIFALACFGLLFLWFKKPAREEIDRAVSVKTENEKFAFKQLVRACQQNSAPEIRRSLLNWAALHWHNHAVTTLDDICHHIQSDALRAQCKALDASLYSAASPNNPDGPSLGSQGIDGQSILKTISDFLQQKSNQVNELASFYPTK